MEKTAAVNLSYHSTENYLPATDISKLESASTRASQTTTHPWMTQNNDRFLGKGGVSRWDGEPTPGRWIRKIGYIETFMKNAADYGILTTLYTLQFESKQRIGMKTIEKTCYIVAR